MGERRVRQENERQVKKEKSEKRLRPWLRERGVRQETERPEGAEESRTRE
jgi:hypothetical protein